MEKSNVWLGQGLVCDIKLQLSSEWTSDAISDAGEAAGNLGEALGQFRGSRGQSGEGC